MADWFSSWIASLCSQWRVVSHCEANVMSRGNPYAGRLVTRLLRFARNDEWEKLDCFTSFAMTSSQSLRGECNEPWQSRIIIFILFSSHEKAPYHSDFRPSCPAAFPRSGVSFWRGGKMNRKVRFFIISRLAWACRKYYRDDRSDAESWLSQKLRKLPWKQSYD